MFASAQSSKTSTPDPSDIDQRVFFHDVPWSHYEVFVALRGDTPLPRIAYLEGVLELMSPSRKHEMIKSLLGQLIELYADAVGLDLWPVGSWTVRSAPARRGAEPDECYTVGDPASKDAPDLAIEVVWTRGGLDKLEIYRKLGVPEVWIWEDHAIQVFVLHGEDYESAQVSALMPDLDLGLMARWAEGSPRDARAGLRAYLADAGAQS